MDRTTVATISKSEADNLLRGHELRIGEWNQIADASARAAQYISHLPNWDASALFVVSHHLARWVYRSGWALVQIDNSNCPSRDEVLAIERIAFGELGQWDPATQRALLFNEREAADLLPLIIFFGLLFEWHLYLVSDKCIPGLRLGIQDGAIHFLGNADVLEEAKALIDCVKADPLRLPTSPRIEEPPC